MTGVTAPCPAPPTSRGALLALCALPRGVEDRSALAVAQLAQEVAQRPLLLLVESVRRR